MLFFLVTVERLQEAPMVRTEKDIFLLDLKRKEKQEINY
jgi:hypothetical protein